jgi:hypothetical protein
MVPMKNTRYRISAFLGSARHAGAAPHSAAAEFGVVRRRLASREMKNLLLPFLFVAVFLFSACDNSHVTGNVPPKADFRPFLVRDLTTYFQRTYGKGITVEYELLRDGPTQVGLSYPKFYIWVTVTKPDKSVVDGAARIAAVNKQEFDITTFIKRSDIIADPTQLTRVFPQALLEKIRTKAGVKQ